MAHVQDRWTRPTGEVTGRGKPVREHTEQWGKGKRWRAFWEDRPGHRMTRLFDTKDAAEAHLAQIAVDQNTGRYVQARRDRTPIGDLWEPYLAAKANLRATTLAGYRSLWKQHLEPRWAATPVGGIDKHSVQAWAAGLPLSVSQRRSAALLLVALLESAVDRKMLPANPIRGAQLPPPPRTTRTALTEVEVTKIAEAMAPHDVEVWTLALTGIRWGELAGLQVGDVLPSRRRLRIARGYVEAGGAGAGRVMHETKTGRVREVPVAGELLAMLVDRTRGRSSTAPLFVGPTGGGWTRAQWRPRWTAATREAGLPGVGAHALRHTAATLAIAAGADVKVVQQMLGHSSGAMTMDIYTHVLDRSLDAVGDRLADVYKIN